MPHLSSVLLEEQNFGTIFDSTKQIKLFTWKNSNNIIVQVSTYGATIISIQMPDKNGVVDDIITGFNSIQEYCQPGNRYFGATIGRVANRINQGQIKINNELYQLSVNRGNYHLHGGIRGFDKVIWEPFINGNKLILSYHSSDLEEGYPGDLVAHVSFELTDDNEFTIQFTATTTKPTVVNMTNHSYFNLAGHDKGPNELYKHMICINADKITEVDENSIPTGVLKSIAGTPFDLQIPKLLGSVINNIPGLGFDHNYCINKGPDQGKTFIARAYHPDSGRVMEIYSNQPGVQFYTSNFLPENPKTNPNASTKIDSLTGKGANYYKHGAFCFETQNWPDAPNHDNFPSSILNPGETYNHCVTYRFSIKDD